MPSLQPSRSWYTMGVQETQSMPMLRAANAPCGQLAVHQVISYMHVRIAARMHCLCPGQYAVKASSQVQRSVATPRTYSAPMHGGVAQKAKRRP